MPDRNFDDNLTPRQDGQVVKSVGKGSNPQLQSSVAFVRPCELPCGVLLEALEALRSVPEEP